MAAMLPVLDLAEADAEPAEFRARLREAAHDAGFFYLVGHGVPQAQVDQVLALAREFFALASIFRAAWLGLVEAVLAGLWGCLS